MTTRLIRVAIAVLMAAWLFQQKLLKIYQRSTAALSLLDKECINIKIMQLRMNIVDFQCNEPYTHIISQVSWFAKFTGDT